MTNEASLKLAQDWSKSAFCGRISSSAQVEVECWRQGWGCLKQGRSIVDGPLCIGGRVFTSGFGSHADSAIALKLPARGKRFRAFVGMDRNDGSLRGPTQEGRIVFSLEAGEKVLFASEPLGLASPPLEITIDLNGAQALTLKARDINGCINYAHVDWADIRIELENGTTVSVGMPVEKSRLGGVPISFRLGSQSSAEVLARSRFAVEPLPGGDGFSRKKAVWDDPVTGLAVALEVMEYADFPAVEYVLRLKNNGSVNTPIIEGILSADFSWPAAKTNNALYRSRGSTAMVEDFLYSKESLALGAKVRMTPIDGRSSNSWLPFFNIEAGKEGFVMAIGWTGAWRAEFDRVDEDLLKIRAGLERTRIALHPGEEIRLPRILLVFWEGEPLDGHNLLRRFLVRHGTPRPSGQLPVTPVSFATWGGNPATAHLDRIKELETRRADCDCYWIDAGWYGPEGTNSATVFTGEWAKLVGYWGINPTAHPGGLKPIADAARKAGMKFLLWFEPERARTGTPWSQKHPAWFLGPHAGKDADLLLNLGIPEARRFVTDYISGMIASEGIDIYRQDFNMDPRPLWLAADAPDRLGMTEIRHIEGLYEFWDELLRRHPHLLIDNCSSGGRRIDIETIRRSIPLWRSDYQCMPEYDAVGSQIQGIGLDYWIPFSSTGTYIRPNDTYDFRSNLAAGIALTPLINEASGMPEDYPWQWLRTMIVQLKRCRPAFSGDFYPLISCTAATDNWTEAQMRAAVPFAGGDHYGSAKDVWVAYQMHRDDLDEGFVVVFRRDRSPFVSAQLALKGLNRDKRYLIEDADSGETREMGGDVLSTEGLPVQITKARESRLFFLKRAMP